VLWVKAEALPDGVPESYSALLLAALSLRALTTRRLSGWVVRKIRYSNSSLMLV
jgi:hypothetical protein